VRSTRQRRRGRRLAAAARAAEPLLEVEKLNAGYGLAHVLHEVSFRIGAESWSRSSVATAWARRPRCAALAA